MAGYRAAIRVLFTLIVLIGAAIGAARITAEEAPKKIRIIYTNDMRGEWIPCG